MKIKHLLFAAALAGSVPAFAATYYVTPEGAGDKTGSDWNNAMGVEEFIAQADNNVDGDVYNLEGGTYNLPSTIFFKKSTYAIVNGSVKGGRTILSGDLNKDGVASEGDLVCLMRIEVVTGHADTAKPFAVNDVDFTCVYTNRDTDNFDDPDAGVTKCIGALYVHNSGNVTIKGCNFYGNTAAGDMGGPAAFAYLSKVNFVESNFFDNVANARGGAVRFRSNNKAKGVAIFENCTFKNNTNATELGGAFFMSHGVSATFINTTFVNNKSASNGAAVYLNSGNDYLCQGTFVSCTIAGNTITGDAQDAQVVSTQYANIHMANTVIVSDNDKTNAILFKSGTAQDKFSFVSGGYNYVGNVIGNEAADKIIWLDSDRYGVECTYASIFGTNTIGEDNLLKAATFVQGASAEELTEATSSWGLPAGIDITKDVLGTVRADKVSVGAYAETEVHIPTGIEDVAADGKQALVSLGNGAYTIAGATSVEAYSVMGCRVATVAGDTVDLSAAAPGMYILKAGNKVFKVIK